MNDRLKELLDKALEGTPELPDEPEGFMEHGNIYYIARIGELVLDNGITTPDDRNGWVLVGNEKDLPPNWRHLKYDATYNRLVPFENIGEYVKHAKMHDLTDSEEYKEYIDQWFQMNPGDRARFIDLRNVDLLDTSGFNRLLRKLKGKTFTDLEGDDE